MDMWQTYILLYHEESLVRMLGNGLVSKVRQWTKMYSDQTTNYNATGKTRENETTDFSTGPGLASCPSLGFSGRSSNSLPRKPKCLGGQIRLHRHSCKNRKSLALDQYY